MKSIIFAGSLSDQNCTESNVKIGVFKLKLALFMIKKQIWTYSKILGSIRPFT